MSNEKRLSGIERIKTASDGLRGSIEESLHDEITGAIREDDQAVIKFHGMYQQDDRDRREERAEKKLDRLYSYMIRLRLPGGLIKPQQWIAAHHVAGEHSTGVIKISTRQTIQLHGILKSHIKPTIQAFHKAHLDSIATCGDINRNVTCTSHPSESPIHAEVFSYADQISAMLMPKTKAYYEIWLDDEHLADKKEEEDPLYQNRYLPRKFKIGIAIPPNNDVDVFTNDIGLIAIIENNVLQGFNIAIGGGLSTTHGNAETYARLGTVIGFAPAGEDVLKAVYEIVTVQRDFGNRTDRKLARLKYTVDRLGVDVFRQKVEERTGFVLEPARPYAFTERADRYGWQQNHEGLWFYTLYVENGRVTDTDTLAMKTALYEIAQAGVAEYLFTANQNLIISRVSRTDKAIVDAILDKYQLHQYNQTTSAIRKNAIACVALPTCPLALAEAQRYMPALLGKIEPLLAKYQLEQEPIVMRMTGCPNGCARPYAAEVGFVGTAPGHYNLHIGGDRQGQRLNQLYRENLNETGLLQALDELLLRYQEERLPKETLGDFSHRVVLSKVG